MKFRSENWLENGKIVFFLRVKDNNNPSHGKFHRFLFPFSSKFPDLNFASNVLYIHPCYEAVRDTCTQ